MTLSQNGIDLIKSFEGWCANQYNDIAGKATIGYGHLIVSGEKFVSPITEAQGEKLLFSDTIIASNFVNTHVDVPLTQNQFDALVSFTFNVGTGALGISSLLKYLNAGNYQDAASQFLVWDKIHKDGQLVESSGLLARRQKESQMFLTPDATSTQP